MSADKEKMEKIADVLRFIDLMVRQTCRRAHYDNQTRTKAIKEDKDSIYSSDHLKKVYDKPREYIYHLLKNPEKTLKGLRVENLGPLPKKDLGKFTKIEQKMLLDFVKKVQEQFPKPHFVWIDLQHYLFYAYRNFAGHKPKPTTETLSACFVCEMKELINCLRREDESQVWLRIFTLLREYCIFAQWHYSQNDKEEAFKKFLAYYEAMLTAAKSLIPVFADFERDIIYKKYRVCWIDFNTFIFIRFFYESDRVQTKIDECLRTKKSPGDSPQAFVSVNKLKKVWSAHQTRISLVNQENKLPENTFEAMREKKNLVAHKKLLTATFWVDRSNDMKKNIDISRMDDNLFDLLKDKQFFPEGPGLNKNGQCICEECLITKFKVFLDLNYDFSYFTSEERTTYCRKCKCVMNLEYFQRHVNSHIEDICIQRETPKPTSLTRIISEKMDFVKLGDSTGPLTEMLGEKLNISSGDILNNVDSSIKHDMSNSILSYENFLQYRKESKGFEKLKNCPIPSLREELIANGFGQSLNDESENPTSPNLTAEKLAETELMLREFRRNEHKPLIANSLDDSAPLGPTDDLDLPKKCDCTYCELFVFQRTIEPRDKLRGRLYRKRERRRGENHNYQRFPEGENNRIKLESRVPLPPSPSNLPSTPPDPSDNSVSSGKMKEIHGLLNYIEGNVANNKVEMAHKKAAKKARQREKKEQEKLQAELEIQRKLEEQARLEEERKRVLEKEKKRLEEQKKLDEAKVKKKLKKQRQAQKRQYMLIQKNTIEETIPAMVTIKRVPGGENGAPSVTITLKGCTPDQDKLLSTLIEDPDIEVVNKISNANSQQNNNRTVPEAKGGKKKKNAATAFDPKTEMKSVILKPVTITKDVKVTLAVDKNPISPIPNSLDFIRDNQSKKSREVRREREPTEVEIRALGNLRLPPGITITKVEGPIFNKNYLGSDANKGSSVLDKSGVIVVETEKLIQKTEADNLKPSAKSGKKKKRKNKKGLETQTSVDSKDKPKMVTLRNPMFQQFQSHQVFSNLTKPTTGSTDESAPAAIFTNENGMVTIRSSRLQQSLDQGMGKPVNAPPLGMPLMPGLLSEVPHFTNPNHYTPHARVKGMEISKEDTNEKSNVSKVDAQEILSGLSGIEITKIDKNNETADECMEIDSSCHDAQVSIIPSNESDFDLEFDKDDDWLYDSVFKPRDVLEDDMDDEELELEAFKRFCQQSVPPKEKKVAHFNVADIVLKKKLT